MLIGDRDCIESGERFPLPIIARDLTTGFDSRCPPIVVQTAAPNIRWCRDQRALVNILKLLYNSTSLEARNALQVFRPLSTVTGVDNTDSPFPGYALSIEGNVTIIVIAGTTNPLQWTLQIVSGLISPVFNGNYSTLAFWDNATNYLIGRLTAAGSIATGPIVIVGHSFGGALACNMAAKLRIGQPNRSIQVLTCGCPKPGDIRLIETLSSVTQVHFVNDDDPVSYLPPGGAEIIPFTGLLPLNLYNSYLNWGVLENRVGLDSDGNRTDNPQVGNVYGLVWRFLLGSITNHIPPVLTAHLMSEYLNRVICAGDPAPGPIPDDGFLDLVLWLRPEELEPLGIGANIDPWPDVSGWLHDGKKPNNFDIATTVVGINGWICAQLIRPQRMVFTDLYPIGDTGTTFVVYQPMNDEPKPVGVDFENGAIGGGGMPTQQSGLLYYQDNKGTLTHHNVIRAGVPTLVSIRKFPDHVELWADQQLLSSGPIPPGGLLVLSGLGVASGPFPINPTIIVGEVIVSPVALEDLEFFAVSNYLCEKFALPGCEMITGSILLHSLATPIVGFLPCDGSAVSRSDFAALFSVIGTTYGIGDGSTTFNVPDLRGRVPLGNGTGAGLSPRAIADKGGEETHQLTVGELATHAHTVPYNANSLVNTTGGRSFWNLNSANPPGTIGTWSEGNDDPHNNMQPFLCMGYFIKT